MASNDSFRPLPSPSFEPPPPPPPIEMVSRSDTIRTIGSGWIKHARENPFSSAGKVLANIPSSPVQLATLCISLPITGLVALGAYGYKHITTGTFTHTSTIDVVNTPHTSTINVTDIAQKTFKYSTMVVLGGLTVATLFSKPLLICTLLSLTISAASTIGENFLDRNNRIELLDKKDWLTAVAETVIDTVKNSNLICFGLIEASKTLAEAEKISEQKHTKDPNPVKCNSEEDFEEF